jgi:hypothetical protein
MRSIRRRLLAGALATGAMALAAPVSGASAAIIPPIGFPGLGSAVGGAQSGSGGCAGTVRPSLGGGNTGSTSAQTCGAVLIFNGPQIGQIASVIGPTIMGVALSPVVVSAGSSDITQ